MFVDPFTIVIREDRQRRTKADREGTKASIAKIGQIHPIVVRKEAGEKVLVVGESRLLSIQELKTEGTKIPRTPTGTEVEIKFFTDLSPREAEIVELEENIKRENLPWREHVMAVGRIHDLYKSENPKWKPEDTAREISVHAVTAARLLLVHRNLSSPLITDCTSFKQAFSVLQSAAERRASSVVADIAKTGAEMFSQGGQGNGQAGTDSSHTSMDNEPVNSTSQQPPLDSDTQHIRPDPAPIPIVADNLVLNLSFLDWAPTYTGPKFTVIHCDFPYDVEYRSYALSGTSAGSEYDHRGYMPLLDCFCEHTDRFASYSSHLIFWFSMKFYEETKHKLAEAGWFVQYRPLVWAKSDNAGIIPGTDAQYPRWTYETAFLASRGRRPLVRQLADHYSAPNQSNPIHPSQKSESVLRHFLSMVVDETTDLLDPTCGSGTALRAADSLGARSILGLEIDKDYATAAEAATQTARSLRRISV